MSPAWAALAHRSIKVRIFDSSSGIAVSLGIEQQIALALRIISGLSVVEIARAFLISKSAAAQRITRAKRRIADAGLPFESPAAAARAERVTAVAAMIYLLVNEGYVTICGDRSAVDPGS
jgi:RNA polymerase sigma-70 factor (ECF subfamily)